MCPYRFLDSYKLFKEQMFVTLTEINLIVLWPNLMSKSCFPSAYSPLSFDFSFFSSSLSVRWFNCVPSSRRKLQYYTTCPLEIFSETMFPSSLSIPLFFLNPSHFHLLLLYIWQCLVTVVFLLLSKNHISQVTSCVCYLEQTSVALCVWHTADMLFEYCRRQWPDAS